MRFRGDTTALSQEQSQYMQKNGIYMVQKKRLLNHT